LDQCPLVRRSPRWPFVRLLVVSVRALGFRPALWATKPGWVAPAGLPHAAPATDGFEHQTLAKHEFSSQAITGRLELAITAKWQQTGLLRPDADRRCDWFFAQHACRFWNGQGHLDFPVFRRSCCTEQLTLQMTSLLQVVVGLDSAWQTGQLRDCSGGPLGNNSGHGGMVQPHSLDAGLA
jgi:hypothetical protein